MISKVQFAGNPLKVKTPTQSAIESYIASRQNIVNKVEQNLRTIKSAGMTRKPIRMQKADPVMVAREESYARSFGVPENVINPNKSKAAKAEAKAESKAEAKVSEAVVESKENKVDSINFIA